MATFLKHLNINIRERPQINYMRKTVTGHLIILFLLCITNGVYSQATGPQCILPGVEYQYNIPYVVTDTGTLKICVHGGTMLPGNDSCYEGPKVPSIRVIWDEDMPVGSVTIDNNENQAFHVEKTTRLEAGEISEELAMQEVDSATVPGTIICTIARGGSCTPAYQYQWERSYDDLHWESLEGATGSVLNFTNSIQQTSFFRRKVTDTQSNSVSYSAIAIVIIKD